MLTQHWCCKHLVVLGLGPTDANLRLTYVRKTSWFVSVVSLCCFFCVCVFLFVCCNCYVLCLLFRKLAFNLRVSQLYGFKLFSATDLNVILV